MEVILAEVAVFLARDLRTRLIVSGFLLFPSTRA
jgi:hypothetical protein